MDLCSLLTSFLLLVGVVAFSRGLCAFFTFLRIAFTKLNNSWVQRYGKGSWAVVTGCTEGIGKAFCFQLAELGFNLVLVSRNEQKLQNLNKDLWSKYPSLNIVLCQADFSQYSRSLYQKIFNKVKHLDISILVNNVGIAHIKKFNHHSTQDHEEIVNVNIKSMIFMTQKFVPMFLERKKKCAIVNLSSQSIAFSVRNLSVYTGTKAFNDSFSKCLSQDYKGVIDIIDCVPAIVSTAGTKQSTDPFACSSENCARWTLKALGKTESTAGHYSHIFQSWLVVIGGDTFSRWMANWKLDSINEKLA